MNTGDFDVVTAKQEAFETELQRHGFVRPRGANLSLRGWIHPDLNFGFEVVGSRLLDGLAAVDLVRVIEVDGHGSVAVISIEDLIADRMGQYASGDADEMLGQARALFTLSQDLDMQYMEKRIREETFGSMAFKTFKTKREAISLSQLGEGIAAARKTAGSVVVPRNSGLRRTESKRKLIEQISRNGSNW